jgi:hypothetical protein
MVDGNVRWVRNLGRVIARQADGKPCAWWAWAWT